MKWGLLLIFVILFSIFMTASPINLPVGSSYLIYNKNISIIATSDDKMLVCINGIKDILNKGDLKIVNGVDLIYRGSSDNIATFDLTYKCEGDCNCKDDCNSCATVDNQQNIQPQISQKNNFNENTTIETAVQKTEVVNNEKVSSVGVIAAILVVIIFFLGVIILWRRF